MASAVGARVAAGLVGVVGALKGVEGEGGGATYHIVASYAAQRTLDPIRCNIFVKSSLDPGGTQRTKSTFSPERVHR